MATRLAGRSALSSSRTRVDEPRAQTKGRRNTTMTEDELAADVTYTISLAGRIYARSLHPHPAHAPYHPLARFPLAHFSHGLGIDRPRNSPRRLCNALDGIATGEG
ncbi:hypothetical protein B0H11DRAFT_2224494 [Mycena galericulata]|nr:hypothetical protein B0H11DRAFT_2224494 [Mycena galericulata]